MDMVTVEVEISPELDFASIEPVVDELVSAAGLQVALKGTLRQYPGCTHWHLKRGREKGTLELTVWPQDRRIWFAVHENRHARWIDAMLKQLKSQLETNVTHLTQRRMNDQRGNTTHR